MIVLLDNGHGIETPGKRSPDGRLREYKYTREIVKGISEKLKSLNITSVILVPEDEDVGLSKRAERANKYANEDSILISVHCNAAGAGDQWMKGTGWEAWTTIGQTESDTLAHYLYEAATERLGGKFRIRKNSNRIGEEDFEKNFTVIFKAKMPAVLTENLFQDNKQEVEFLLSDEGRQAIIDLHVDGIVNYMNSRKS